MAFPEGVSKQVWTCPGFEELRRNSSSVEQGRWVATLAVAALSIRGLATALVFLRGALIRIGIGALIAGAGEMV